MSSWTFNFRASNALTYGPNSWFIDAGWATGTTIPTTSLVVGWDTGPGAFDRTTTDLRLSGFQYAGPGATKTFQFTLPTGLGPYTVQLAMGDVLNAWGSQKAIIKDNGNPLHTMGPLASGTAHWRDILGADCTDGTYPVSAAKLLNFTTAIFQVTIGDSDYNTLATLTIANAPPAGAVFKSGGNMAGLGAGGPFFGNPMNTKANDRHPDAQFVRHNHIFVPAAYARGGASSLSL